MVGSIKGLSEHGGIIRDQAVGEGRGFLQEREVPCTVTWHSASAVDSHQKQPSRRQRARTREDRTEVKGQLKPGEQVHFYTDRRSKVGATKRVGGS